MPRKKVDQQEAIAVFLEKAVKQPKAKRITKKSILESAGNESPGENNARCLACGAYKDCATPFMRSASLETDRLCIVVASPSREDTLRGEHFVGPDGMLFKKYVLNVLGVGRSKVDFVYAVKCRPDKLAAKHIELCSPFLRQDIERLCPASIIVLGLDAARGLFPSKNLRLKDLLDTVHTYTYGDGQRVATMVTHSPGNVLWGQRQVGLSVIVEHVRKFLAGEMLINKCPTIIVL